MRFRIDPFSMYDARMDDYYLSHFLSTLGQNTWYSSYMVIIIPLGMIAYWCAQKLWQKFAFGAFLVMSFMTAVTQNSDSAYLAMAGMFFIFFWISFDSNVKFLRFLECLIIALALFKVIGLLQMLFPEQAVPLDALSIFMSQSVVTLVLFIVVLAFYFLFRFVIFQKTDLQIESFAKMRWGVLALAAVVIFAIIIYIVLNSTGKLPEQYALSAGYLYTYHFHPNGDGRFGNPIWLQRGLQSLVCRALLLEKELDNFKFVALFQTLIINVT